MRRALGATLVALVCTATPAAATQTTQTFRYGPIQIAPYGVDERDYVYGIPSPQVDGYLTGGTARLVDAQGRPVSLARVMLHHVVFGKVMYPDLTCTSFRGYDGRATPFPVQRFYAEGEEHTQLALPDGYGYPNRGTDVWGVLYMLMNHHAFDQTVYVQELPARQLELALWLDGKLIMHVAKGTSRGPWSGMGFDVLKRGGEPFEAAGPTPELLEQALRRHALAAGGRQLDRQRQPIEPGAELRDRRPVLRGEHKLGPDRLKALDKERDGRVLRQGSTLCKLLMIGQG